MIAVTDPTGKKRTPTGYERVLMKTLGDRYDDVPQERIDMFNKILSSGNFLENREEVSDALRYLVDNYGMNTDSLTKNIVDYNIERKNLGMLGSVAEKAKIMAGMKAMGYNNGGILGENNGDPPKGYRRDADGYLTPVDFDEFHEEGDGPRGISTDAFLAGITAAESSSSPTTKQELTDVFTRKRDLRNALGSSAGGAAQVIPGYFQGEDTQTDQYRFMTRRVDEGVSGESSLRQQAKQNYDRYEKEIPQEVWNSLGLTYEDFMAGFHFAGSGRFRGYMADLREGRITPQEFLDKKPTSGNMTMGEYLNRFRKGSAAYRD